MTEQFTTKDSGDRRVFTTGAQRDQSSGKGRFDLIPSLMLRRWAELMERGAVKYGDRNWEKGMPLKAFLDSAMRHLVQLGEGDRTEDHAAAVLFNVAGLEWTLERIQKGTLPAELADGTAFVTPAKTVTLVDPNGRERDRVVSVNPLAQRPGENAFQHRARVNSPWPVPVARQPDDFAEPATQTRGERRKGPRRLRYDFVKGMAAGWRRNNAGRRATDPEGGWFAHYAGKF